MIDIIEERFQARCHAETVLAQVGGVYGKAIDRMEGVIKQCEEFVRASQEDLEQAEEELVQLYYLQRGVE